MKRWIAMMLAAALMLCCAAAAAGGEAAGQTIDATITGDGSSAGDDSAAAGSAPTARTFLGEWVDLDGTCNIDIDADADGDSYLVSVRKYLPTGDGSGFDYLVWIYDCVYDGETRSMKSIACAKGAGSFDSDEEEYVEADEEAEFCFDDAGFLLWIDKAGGAGEDMTFQHTIGWIDPDYVGPGAAFLGEWHGERADISVEVLGENEYGVYVSSGDTVWAYLCRFDEGENALVSEGTAYKIHIPTDDSGEGDEEFVYDDGSAAFRIDGEGRLVWDDRKEGAGEGMTFGYVDDADDGEDPDEADYGDGTDASGVAGYEGTWVSDRATLTIEELDDAVYCTIQWGSSAFESVEWEYQDCLYDEVTGGLTTPETGVKRNVTYGEDGDVVSSEIIYDDGAASFVLDDEGRLVWTDFKETPGENRLTFERAEFVPEDTLIEELAEDFIQVVAGIEQGTAGASLKQAIAACEVLRFAAGSDLAELGADGLKACLGEAMESVDEEARAAFEENLDGMAALLNACLEDWEANRPLFDDAGVAEEMDALVSDAEVRLNWEMLRDAARN